MKNTSFLFANGTLFNNKFDFDEHVSALCRKTSQNLNALVVVVVVIVIVIAEVVVVVVVVVICIDCNFFAELCKFFHFQIKY